MSIIFYLLFSSQNFVCLVRGQKSVEMDFFFSEYNLLFWLSYEGDNNNNKKSELSSSSKNNYHNISDVFNTLWPVWPAANNKDQVMNSRNE